MELTQLTISTSFLVLLFLLLEHVLVDLQFLDYEPLVGLTDGPSHQQFVEDEVGLIG